MLKRAALALGILGLGLSAADASAQRQLKEERIADGALVTVLPPGAIRALDQPVFVTHQEADRWMADDEPVLGLVDPDSEQAKAYSLWHLDHHEVVNDRVEGKTVAVTR